MEILELSKLKEKELMLRNVFHIKRESLRISDLTIHNPFGLKLYEKENDLFISAKEVSKLLEETKYGIGIEASLMECNEPLFDKHKRIYDLLLDVYSLKWSISEVANDNRENTLK